MPRRRAASEMLPAQSPPPLQTSAETAQMLRMLLAGRAGWMIVSAEEAQVLRQDAGSYIVRASITRALSGMVWTATLWQPKGASVEDSLDRLAADFASRIGTFSSPLYERARGWLQSQQTLPDNVTGFICTVSLMDWADSLRPSSASKPST